MRVWIRTSRHTGVSLGPVALLVLLPFLAAFWALYVAALLVCFLGVALVHGLEAAGRAIEHRQARRGQ
jgi:hypothetical protein